MRRLKHGWIDEYLAWVSPISESTDRLNYWSAIAVLSATLKRHVWVARGSYKLYPNMYTIFVGRAGIGKGAAIRPAQTVLTKAGSANMLTDRMSIEWHIDQIAKGFPSQIITGAGGISVGTDNSCLIVAPEMSTLLRHGMDPLGDLCALWDSTEQPFKHGTLSGKLKEVAKPCQSLFGGTTPRFIARYFPLNASAEGFTRRTNFIFEKERGLKLYDVAQDVQPPDELIDDLRHIHTNIQGVFSFEPNAIPVFRRIYDESEAGDLDDEDTEGYHTSKWVHCVKIAMALSAAERDDRVICGCHLLEAEREINKNLSDLPTVFRATGESDMAGAADRVMKLVELKGYASRGDMLHTLWRHVSSADLDIILATLTQGGLLDEKVLGNRIFYYDPKASVAVNP